MFLKLPALTFNLFRTLPSAPMNSAFPGSIDNYTYMYNILYIQPRTLPMAHVSYTELRNNLSDLMDEVCDSRAPLLVTRQNARSVVMVSEDEYEGLMETVHLLRSPANTRRLLELIAEANSGKLSAFELIKPKASSSKA